MSELDRRPAEDTLAWNRAGGGLSLADLTGVTLGDFQIEKLLGRGGMGEVYLATQLSLNRPIALKVLRPDLVCNPTYLSRFRTEATAVAKLNHANIVHVYVVGCIDQVHFIAMEYVQGTNLRDYILKKGALDLSLAFSIMRQTGQAIGAAGEVGLIHRDIKPENILVTRKGKVKVADFGLCRDQESANAHVTQSGITMGTPLYISPEQAQGHAIDHRSDLYSLGVTFYHMLAGVPPFRADTALALALKHVREAPRSMLVHRPDIPVEIDRLVLKLMEKNPDDRYQSAALMLADLAKIRESVSMVAMAPLVETNQDSRARADESLATPSHVDLSSKAALSLSALAGDSERLKTLVSPKPAFSVRFSWRIAISTAVACLLAGAIAGWSARSPDALAVPIDPAQTLPVLWIEPRWSSIPKQPSAADQMRYAQFQAPPDELVAAWLAIPGYFPHSVEAISKAYIQLARIWYRRLDLPALLALKSELTQWTGAQGRDKELVAVIHIAIDSRKGDIKAVIDGLKTLTKDDVPDMYDPALVEMCLEISSDAIAASVSGNPAIVRQELQKYQRPLVNQLYRIEVLNPANRKGADQKR
jgi:eukaryotic-like serine/threonine-protein kinase